MIEWLQSRLGQIIALVAVVSTIAGFGYTGAEYIQRIENLEKKSGVSYTKDINELKSQILVINQKLERLELLDTLQTNLNENNKDWALLKEQYMNFQKDLGKLEEKIKEDKNPLAN